MDNKQKAVLYGQYLNEHTRLSNRISSIKGESIELTRQQLGEIEKLKQQQLVIMRKLENLMR